MRSDISEMVDNVVKTRRPRGKKNRGPLHSLLSRGLPDLCDANGLCNLYHLARCIGISRQAVHKWMPDVRNNHIPAKAVDNIVKLSKKMKNGGADFKPLSREDFIPFVF